MNSAEETRPPSPWPTRIAVLVLLLAAVVGVFWSARIIAQYAHIPPDFDEAVHLLPVRQLALDVRSGDIAAFVRHTLNQDSLAAYPFLHSWLTFPVWLVWPSITAVRVLSSVFLIAAALLAFAIGHDLAASPRLRWLAGLTSGGLLLLSFPLWVYGALAYLEGAGLMVTLLALWLYGRSDGNGRWARQANQYALFASLAVAAAFFTKYNFGLFLVGGIVLNELAGVWRHQSPARVWMKRWLYLAGPTAVLLLLWCLYPGHWERFWVFGRAQEGGLGVGQLESWLYYWRSLFTQYVNGLPFVLLLGGGLLYGLWHWRSFGVRSLLAYALVSWLLLILVPQKAPRFLYTVAPALFPLAGAFVTTAADWLRRQRRVWQFAAVGMVILWLVWAETAVVQRFRFWDTAVAAGYIIAQETRELQQFIAANTVAQNQRVVILNGWHQFSAPALQWAFYDSQPDSPIPFDAQMVSTQLVPEPTPENLEALVSQWRAQGVTMLVSIDGSPAGAHSGWSLIEPLLTQGIVEPVTSSTPVILPTKSFDLQEALLSGKIGSAAELDTAVAEASGSLNLQFHLYRLRDE